jgi:CheY-like chemotaxis protein
MPNPVIARPTVMWVDNDLFPIKRYFSSLTDEGIDLVLAQGPNEALARLEKLGDRIKLVILDVWMDAEDLPIDEAMAGYRTGVALARRIRAIRPDVALLGVSSTIEPDVKEWFEKFGKGFLDKDAFSRSRRLEVFHKIKTIVFGSADGNFVKSFIVHGHDNTAVLELRDYIQRTLGWKPPVVLRDMPNNGRSIIEKFEDEAALVDVVFVLLTPDDVSASASDANELKRRARQNVIFELGYFVGRLNRRSGRIILLHKGPLELPSDIAGVIYIDINAGITAAGEYIRREVAHLGAA